MLDNNLKVSEKENQTCRIWCEYIPTKDKESECIRNNYIYNVERNKQTYDNRKPNEWPKNVLFNPRHTNRI